MKTVNIIGGCCGSTPEHIRLIAEVANQYQPEKFVERLMETRYLKLSDWSRWSLHQSQTL